MSLTGWALRLSPLPNPSWTMPATAIYLHVSVYSREDGTPVLFGPSGALSEPGSGFVASVLEHSPALIAFTASSPNSY